MRKLRLALGQINPTVGDLRGNADMIIEQIGQARKAGANIVAFPELALTGYPPEDLLLKPRFIDDNLKELQRIIKATSSSKATSGSKATSSSSTKSGDITVIVGFVDRRDDIFNAAAIISDGALLDVYHKIYLPNYGVFDEYRYFQAGSRCPLYRIGDVLVGVNICEDMWYPEGPSRLQALAGAELVVNINASPYSVDKRRLRDSMLQTRATDNSMVVAYLNMVGGQDEVVFDGGSFVVDERGELVARAAQFRQELLLADIELDSVFTRRLHDPRRRQQAVTLDDGDVDVVDIRPIKAGTKKLTKRMAGHLGAEHEVYEALKLGVSDYLNKNGFIKHGVVIGLSGGIDSALVAAIAVDALGADNVRTVFMPSRYSSSESLEDAEALARTLGVRFDIIPIDDLFTQYVTTMSHEFKGRKPDVTEENLQARIRGNLLMAISNKTGAIVLTTGNKSEMSVGYATLYGDMAGGVAVIKDVPKMMAYALAHWRNAQGEGAPVIPERILTKAPTAELREDQRDSDSLPPYEVLDPILEAYIEDEKSFDEMVDLGLGNRDTVRRVINLVDNSEYKRRQSPPGIKITSRAFGKDWRVPITNRYKIK